MIYVGTNWIYLDVNLVGFKSNVKKWNVIIDMTWVKFELLRCGQKKISKSNQELRRRNEFSHVKHKADDVFWLIEALLIIFLELRICGISRDR